MAMPSRMEIRRWLMTKSNKQIEDELSEILFKHGFDNEQDVRHFLNHELELFDKGKPLETPAESAYLNEHEEMKRKIQEDLKFKKRLYQDSK